MGELENFVVCTINSDLTKMTLKTYQPDLINKMNQGFNEDLKSIVTCNTPATLHQDVVHNQETYIKIIIRYT